MKLSLSLKKIAVEIICLLYILLFVYAAVSKIMDFETFQVQLGQSPIISPYAGILSVLVPGTELLIAVLLLFPKFRLVALLMSLSLMIMFTVYIVLILNWSYFVPCSCGGILEKLGWTEHLVFNIFFCILGLIAVLTERKASLIQPEKYMIFLSGYYGLTIILISSASSIVFLYLMSEYRMENENPFIRRFIGDAVKSAATTLPNNNYYFAGKDSHKIYLANSHAPLYITEIDKKLKKRVRHKIELEDYNFSFTNIHIQIAPPFFYLYDGTVPIIYKGSIKDWKAKIVKSHVPYFSQAVIMDSITVAFRSETDKQEFVLGRMQLTSNAKPEFKYGLLTKQIDGFFDSDGFLQFDTEKNKLAYLYNYRNEYLLMDNSLNILSKGTTIDTTTTAKIKVAYIESKKEYKMSAPPHILHKFFAMSNGLLCVNAATIGKYEEKVMWQQASVLDIYNIDSKTYRSSIYIYDEGKLKVTDMLLDGNDLYVLLGYHLHYYKLKKI